MKSSLGCILLITVLMVSGCKKKNNFLLSPARKMAGTWESTFPIRLAYVSDECGNLWKLGEKDFHVTWLISKKNKNEVDITMQLTSAGNYTDFGNCSFWYTAFWDAEEYYTGTISSSRLVVYDLYGDAVGDFSFTSDILTGTFWDVHCALAYCTGWASNDNAFKLVRAK